MTENSKRKLGKQLSKPIADHVSLINPLFSRLEILFPVVKVVQSSQDDRIFPWFWMKLGGCCDKKDYLKTHHVVNRQCCCESAAFKLFHSPDTREMHFWCPKDGNQSFRKYMNSVTLKDELVSECVN